MYVIRACYSTTSAGTWCWCDTLWPSPIGQEVGKYTVLGPVHTNLLAKTLVLAIQKWVENFAKEWIEYPFLAIPANTPLLTLSVTGP